MDVDRDTREVSPCYTPYGQAPAGLVDVVPTLSDHVPTSHELRMWC